MIERISRGKRFDNGEWVYWDRYGRITDINGEPTKTKIDIPTLHPYPTYIADLPIIDDDTVGDYTGVTDKNGKRIFEGDICKTYFESYTHGWEEVGVVAEFCGAYGIESADEKYFRAFINESVYTRSHEVISTIYDNPELLEVCKEVI